MNLSNAKVGDKYLPWAGYLDELTVLGVSDEQICFVYADKSGFMVTDIDGRDTDGGSVIKSKIDPRSWLKDMPDAGIFTGEFIAFQSTDGGWHVFDKEPKMSNDDEHFSTNGMFSLYHISGIKMPELTADQWKDSKISIAELKQWQADNKAKS